MFERMEKNSCNLNKFRNQGFSILELTVVLAIVMAIATMAIPAVYTVARELRTAGDARDLNGAIVLAKMRAAANFAHARVYADLSANTFRVEWQQPGMTGWTPEGGDQYLSKGVSFGFGSLSTPPPNTQGWLHLSHCNGDTSKGCITFNSRGIPINSFGVPTPNDAIYVTDGRTVTGVTVSATGLTKIWRTEASAANWQQK
jgi:Tfp pilus assembly protein FimT